MFESADVSICVLYPESPALMILNEVLVLSIFCKQAENSPNTITPINF